MLLQVPESKERTNHIGMDGAFRMDYLHNKNILHFDLKSDILLINLRDPQLPICMVRSTILMCSSYCRCCTTLLDYCFSSVCYS